MAPKSDPRNDEAVNIMIERILKNTPVTVQDALIIIQKGFSKAEMKDKKLVDNVRARLVREYAQKCQDNPSLKTWGGYSSATCYGASSSKSSSRDNPGGVRAICC
jgi:hypothetical protein